MVKKSKSIMLDGKLVPWDDANIHVMTHTLHYGLGVFEGIRAYELSSGRTGFFRLTEHMQRLHDSAKLFWMDIPFTVNELVQQALELFRHNSMKHGYLRPLAYYGEGEMGIGATNQIQVAQIAWEWGRYLGDEGVKNGIRAKISSYNRLKTNVNLSKSKACGNYLNSILAKREAKLCGMDEAIMLDTDGFVAEATGENIFVIKNKTVYTPPLSSPILDGITRATVIQLLRDHGHTVCEQLFTREELYLADEVFLTGTAAEVTPVREIDGHAVGTGKPGPITQWAQKTYLECVTGKLDRYGSWITVV